MRGMRTHWSLLVLMVLALVPARSAGAGDVPFGVQQVISTAAHQARSVFAADVDGDGVCDGGNTVGGTCTAGPDNCPFFDNPGQAYTGP